MKRKLSAQQVAHELANIMVEHLETLPPREREKKIKAGQKIMKTLKEPAAVVSGTDTKASLTSDTSRFPLAARGR